MEIKAPDLGVDSAEVSEILVAVGDNIDKNDNIVLLESDKASVEVPSSQAGTVTKISVNIGDNVSEGDVLIELDSTAAAEDSATDENKQNEQKAQINTEERDKGVADSNESEDRSATGAASEKTYALPDIGVDEAQVAEIMVAIGDDINAEDPILLIESDKASVEVPAPVSGKVVKLLINDGDMVANGQDFIVISSKDGSDTNANVNDTDTEGKGSKSDDAASQDSVKTQTLQPSKTSKPSQKVNSNIATSTLTEDQVNEKLSQVYAGPAVRKLARQLGVDITKVTGSAVNNRILKEDLFGYVKSHISEKPLQQVSSNVMSSSLPNLPDMSKTEIWGDTETVELSRLQKVSIPQLNYNTHLPQVTQFDLADITDTESLRGELKGGFKKQGIGLTILAFIVKATAHALTQHPKFNSHLNDDNTKIIIRKSVHIGIAVATDDGLIVPVVKDAQDKGIKQIAIDIGELAEKARNKKLTTKDLQGASFTVSSQGNLGGTYFTPLVNWPQVGILGVSEATMQPRWNKQTNSFEPRLMLPLSLSYDHRVINGADAAVFTRYVATLLADPRRILL